MTRCMRLQRFIILGTSALAFLAVTWGLPRAGLGQGAANAVDLLTAAPFDKVTLNDGNVLFIDPVLPRPLPVYDPAKEEKKKRAKREIPAEGNIGFPGEKSKVKMPDEEEELASVLTIHLLQGDVRDFTVKRTNIKSIEYFEDMLLAEGEKLMLARDFTRAFECYLKVRRAGPELARTRRPRQPSPLRRRERSAPRR